jgi:hypothetical protein
MTTNTNTKAQKTSAKGSAVTARCTMPKSQWKRFGVTAESSRFVGATTFSAYRQSPSTARWVKKMSEGMKTLRQMQGVATDTKLPAPVRSAIKFFSIPYSPDAPRQERRKLDAYEATGSDPRTTPLKV